MMWILFFLLVATAVASDYEKDLDKECSYLINKKCVKENFPKEIPGNEEELLTFCAFGKEYFRCTSEVLENCEEDEGEERKKLFPELSRVLNHVCQEETRLFKDLANNLQCITSYLTLSYECAYTEERNNSDIAKILIDFPVLFKEPEECLKTLSAMGCVISKLGRSCGDEAKEVLTVITQQFDYPFEACHPGVKIHLRDIVKVFDEELEKRKDKKKEEEKREDEEREDEEREDEETEDVANRKLFEKKK